jgi:hypothetical protein
MTSGFKNLFYKSKILHTVKLAPLQAECQQVLRYKVNDTVCSVFCTQHNDTQLLATNLPHYCTVNSPINIPHPLFQIFWCWQWQTFVCDIAPILYGTYSLLLHYITTLSTQVRTTARPVCVHIAQSQPKIIRSDTEHFISQEK